MSHNHKTTEKRTAEINKILAPLNGEKLHIIPCLFFNQKSKHIFPYRIKFLLPQLFGYADTRQSTVCISYLGAALQFQQKTDSAKKSFTQILQEQNFKPIKQLLNPIENNLLPQAETVVCPTDRETTKGTIEHLNNRYPVNSDLVINRYTCYYQILYNTYKQKVSHIFPKPANCLCFHESELSDITPVLNGCNAPCTVGDILQRRKMLEDLTCGGTNFNVADKYDSLASLLESDCYEESQRLDPSLAAEIIKPPSIMQSIASFFTPEEEDWVEDYLQEE